MELEDAVDRFLTRFVSQAPGWLVVAVALILYPGVALVVPLGLGWKKPFLIEVNVLGALLAAVVGLGWLGVRLQRLHRQHLVQWNSDLRLLDSEEFEWFVGELFRREGWEVTECGRPDAPDGNLDLELRRGAVRRVVQCKRWTSWIVGVDEIRMFLGALMRESLPAKAGLFVTLSTFARQARAEAEEAGLELMDGSALYAMIERNRIPEPCPVCEAPMLLDRSSRGWWLRCISHGCTGKRDLSGDPERAVALLTSQPSN